MNRSVLRDEVDLYVGDDSFPDEEALESKYGVGSPKRCDVEASNSAIQDREKEFSLREGKLLNMIEQKNKKIEHLCVLMEALEPAPGMDAVKYKKIIESGAEDVDFRDSKIVALAKKSQKLTMTLNKERALSENLAQQLKEQQALAESLSQQLTLSSKGGSPSRNFGPRLTSSTALNSSGAGNTMTHSEPARAENIELKQELASLNKALRESNKLTEDLKQKVGQLGDENKALTRTLQQELGDATTVEHAVDGGWRGRAQQIVMLKAKIRKLESESGGKATTSSAPSRYGSTGARGVDAKAEGGLAEMSNERRMVTEMLTEERARLLEANQELEKKNTGHKARIQILETDAKKMKENLQLVLSKTASDDELLDALRSEISKLKQQAKQHGNGGTRQQQQEQQQQLHLQTEKDAEAQRYHAEILRLQRLCKHQAEQIDSQDQTIRKMKKAQNINV